jgi:transcriptional regulator of acetoin/glycerol metabolism
MENSQETKEKVNYIFETLFDCDTTITEFSKMTGISRATLHHWKRGGGINDQLRLEIAYKKAKRL